MSDERGEEEDEFAIDLSSLNSTMHEKKGVQEQIVPQARAAKQYSAKELEDLRKSFDVFDADKDGSVQEEDIVRVMGNNAMQITPEQIREIFEVVDTDGSGSIEFDEFTAMMKSVEDGKSALSTSLFTDAAKSELRKAKRERLKRFSTFNPETKGMRGGSSGPMNNMAAVKEKPVLGWEGGYSHWKSPDDRLDLHIYRQGQMFIVTPFHSKSHQEWAYLYLNAELIDTLEALKDPEEMQANPPTEARPTRSLKGGGARRVTVQISAEQQEARKETLQKRRWDKLADWIKNRMFLTTAEEQAKYEEANPCDDNEERQPWHYTLGVKFKKTPSDPAEHQYEVPHPETNDIEEVVRTKLHANHAEMFKRKSNAAALQMEEVKANNSAAKQHMAGVGLAYKVFTEMLTGTDNSKYARAKRGLKVWAQKTKGVDVTHY